jgi:Mn2+/Fe2+ NRAMP family transporter
MPTELPMRAARVTAGVVVGALLVAAMAAASASAATKDPKTTKQAAALLTAKKLGCDDFATVSGTVADPALQAVVTLVGNASVGTCTVNDQQTVVVVFKNQKARQDFETRVGSLPCPIVTALVAQLAPSTTQTSAPSTTSVKIPVAKIGSRTIIFSTGSAPDSNTVDLAAAATTDGTVAKKTGGKLRTFTFTC